MKTPKMYALRARFLQWLVNHTSKLYLNTIKRHKPIWKYSKDELRSFPTGSLGKEIANFLDEHQIDFIPRAENHDVFHLLTGYTTTAEDEIAMQYWLVGNQKLTPYTIGTCLIGMLVFPEFWGQYMSAFRKGKSSPSIVHWDFEQLLYSNAQSIQLYIQSNRLGAKIQM